MPKWILRGARLRQLWSASIHNAPLLGPRGNRQGWETLESPVAVSGQIILKVALELFAEFHKLTKEVQEDLLQSCICSETEKFLE